MISNGISSFSRCDSYRSAYTNGNILDTILKLLAAYTFNSSTIFMKKYFPLHQLWSIKILEKKSGTFQEQDGSV